MEVKGINIRYKSVNEGSDRNVVLIHGMAFNADTWEKLGTLNKLGEAGFAVYAIDMPGFGKSSGKRLNRWVAAGILREILDKLGLGKVVLVGPSMGGGIALAFAVNYSSRLNALVLIAPAGLNDERIIESLDKISIPVLVFWGEKDRIFPLDMAYYLKEKIKQSELVICPKAKHPCYLDTPDLFHNKLIKFLNKTFLKK